MIKQDPPLAPTTANPSLHSARFAARILFICLFVVSICLFFTINWNIFTLPTLHTLIFATSVALLAVPCGTFLAITALISQRKILLTAIAVTPLCFPSAAIGIAISASPLPVPSYSWALLACVYFIYSVPIGYIFQMLFLAPNFPAIFAQAATLAIPPARALRLLLLPRLKLTSLSAFYLVTIWIIFDSSANLVFTGNFQTLAKVFYSALSAAPVSIFDAIKIGLFSATCATMISLFAPLSLSAGKIHTSKLHISQYFSDFSRKLFPIAAISGVVLFSLLVSALRIFANSEALQIPWEELFNTLLILLLTVPLSATTGVAFALHRWKYPQLFRYFLIFAALFGFTCAGQTASALFQNPLHIGKIQILPALIGAGAWGNGIFGMILCYICLCVPVAYLIADIFILKPDPSMISAQLLRAPRLRILLLALRENRYLTTAIAAILSAIVVSQTAPGIFVQPADFPLLAPAITTSAEAGLTAQAFAASLASALLSLLFLIFAAFIFKFRRKGNSL
ncbi:hypothetical protein [Arcanobacterium hippocoleae]|uniref:Uncharacterized protein n=1 Tax=Arcanobacterium hippocoleae TaxID=149017 RepID=A0ABU1T3B2_9ACTO|nr:hypothetical protein [Arcanobacterium hippocoleae]MDR6939879.1 hypothetical protein [Arcanobacterium hippocoleae]